MAVEGRLANGFGFVARERARQGAFFETKFTGLNRYAGAAHRLLPAHRFHNLAPSIRDLALKYFGDEIGWHVHANHGLSSQVCCLNFLMPLAERPQIAFTLVGRRWTSRSLKCCRSKSARPAAMLE